MATKQEKYKKIFLTEGREHLETLNASLLKFEKRPSVKLANELMRASHTLKSMAAAMGFNQLSTLCHAMEDAFDGVRAKKIKLTPETIEFLFKCFDTIGASLDAVKKDQPELNTSSLVEKIESLIKKKPSKQKEIKEDLSSEALAEEERVEGAALAEKPETIKAVEEIKVDIETLDNLMNLTEEFLVNKMRFGQIAETKNYDDLPGAIDAMRRLVSDLQYNVTQARMVPIGQIFDRFPRMIRDLAKQEKKIVELETEGGEIELDRTILDKIGEPLVHLLRNAVDHGIETKGKVFLTARREKGYVIIEVANTGVPFDLEAIKEAAIKREIITARKAQGLKQEQIIDLIYNPRLSTSKKVTETSGRGIGLNIVKTRIESLGGTVSLESPIHLVRNAISNGVQESKGTKFTLKLPLTLAIIQALLFKVSGKTYALPLTNIQRLVRVLRKDLKKALDVEVAVVNEQDIPLIRLDKLFSSQFFDLLGAMRGRESRESEVIIIVKKEDKPVAGLVVDELMSGQEIVIKPLTGTLRQSKGFVGITILGDGRPALILDITTLI